MTAPFTVTIHDVEKAGMAIFEHRKTMAKDGEARYRVPMMYREYTWAGLPATQKVYHCDMAVAALTAVGIACPNSPAFVEPA